MHPRTQVILAALLLGAAGAQLATEATAISYCPRTAEGDHWGDNHVSCAFRCDGGQRLTISVRSADGGTVVTGQGDCGDVSVGCSGQGVCNSYSVDLVERPSDHGYCQASSDEWRASDLTVSCSAYYACGASCADYACNACNGQGQVRTDGGSGSSSSSPASSQAGLPYSSVVIAVENGVGSALVCSLGACVPVKPVCSVLGEVLTCRVG